PGPEAGAGVHPKRAAPGGVGLQLLRRYQDRGRPHPPASGEARPRARGADRDDPRRGLPGGRAPAIAARRSSVNISGRGEPAGGQPVIACRRRWGVGSSYVAGANDYNSYNGNSDFGYYTSGNAKAWTDNGPLDLFPEGPDHAAGDPGVAIDVNGVVYFSGIYFDYSGCSVGGNELARYDPGSGTWSY